jgi:hypothetical protein
MKTIFTLLLSTIFSLTLLAYEGARLTISSISNNKMFVEVNGRRYNLDGNTVSVRDIRAGFHTIKVYREAKRNNGRWWDFGIGNNRRQETIYNNRVYLKEGYHFDILINRFGKVLVDERRMDRNDDWYNDDDYRDRDNDRDRDWDRDRDRDRDRDDRYDNFNGRAMSDYDFNQAKETLRREWFENTRVSTARQIIDRNYFTSRQVKEMILLFTFENNRLEIAKYAYGRTVDKGNYFVVNDAFTFNSNKDELARYIREFK